MSQQSNDDLARALDGLEDSKPASPGAQQRPAPKIPQIKIQQAPAKPPIPVARPSQPGANPAAPASKGIPMPRPAARPAGVPATSPSARASRASSPLDAPAALASAMAAKPGVTKASQKPAARGSTLARTMIPVLLTLGFILVALGVVRFEWKSIDNPTMDVSPKVAVMIGGFGVVLWGLAAFVMASVARQLRTAGENLSTAAAAAPSTAPKPRSRAAQPD